MSNFSVTQLDASAVVSLSEIAIASYVVKSNVAAVDVPKPYVHPLRTPNGVEITGFAPEDHPWHHGLQFAFPRVGDHNLWGGGTYLGPEGGYQVGEDHGRMVHESWLPSTAVEIDEIRAGAVLEHTLNWQGHNGEPLVHEERKLTFRRHCGEHNGIIIDFSSVLENATGKPLELATPAQRGRPDGGYGGLFLRLGEGFTASKIHGEYGEITASGSISRTCVVHGQTGTGELVTLGLSFIGSETPGAQKWLYRFEEFAAIGWAVSYDDALTLAPDSLLSFNHRLAIFDGHIDTTVAEGIL